MLKAFSEVSRSLGLKMWGRGYGSVVDHLFLRSSEKSLASAAATSYVSLLNAM